MGTLVSDRCVGGRGRRCSLVWKYGFHFICMSSVSSCGRQRGQGKGNWSCPDDDGKRENSTNLLWKVCLWLFIWWWWWSNGRGEGGGYWSMGMAACWGEGLKMPTCFTLGPTAWGEVVWGLYLHPSLPRIRDGRNGMTPIRILMGVVKWYFHWWRGYGIAPVMGVVLWHRL